MSLRFIDSFSHYAIGDIATKWTSLDFSSLCSIGTGRFGGGSFHITNPNGPRNLKKTIDAQQTWIIGFGFKMSVLPASNLPILTILDASSYQMYVTVMPDGLLRAYRGDGTLLGSTSFAIKEARYNYIEFKT